MYSAIWSGTGLLESDTDVVTSLLSDVITVKPGIFLNDPNKVVVTDQTSGFRMYKIIVAPEERKEVKHARYAITFLQNKERVLRDVARAAAMLETSRATTYAMGVMEKCLITASV